MFIFGKFIVISQKFSSHDAIESPYNQQSAMKLIIALMHGLQVIKMVIYLETN